MDKTSVSIVVPNYNGENLIDQTLSFIVKASETYAGESEIIVVDDASSDDSVNLIQAKFPDVNLIVHDRNKGFSEAVLTGVRSSNFPIVLLLNSDTRPKRDFILPLIAWFEHEDTFSVSPLIVNQNGFSQRVSWVRGVLKRGDIRNQSWELSTALEMANDGRELKSLYASGGSIAFRKAMFVELEGFLPIYKPFYGEDRDLGTRAWKRGWKTFFEPRSVVVHDHIGTIRRFFRDRQVRTIRKRNRFLYLWLHLSTKKLLLSHFPWILLRLPGRLLQLDLVFVMALLKAVMHWKEVYRLRSKPGRVDKGLSLEDILDQLPVKF
jgi:GT2 family glycosyltransferase